MKKLTIMIIAVLIGSSAIGQKYFEGKATYQMSINGFGAGSTTNVVYYRADGSYVYNTMMLKTIHFADRNESYSIMKSKDKIISIDTLGNFYRKTDTIYYGIDAVDGQLCTRLDTKDSMEDDIVCNRTSMIYHDLDTVDGRKCVKIISSSEDGSMSFTDTTWIDTTVNVRNEQSPSGKGLNIKNIGVMKRGKIKMGSTQQLVSIEEIDVPDSIFVLPQPSSQKKDTKPAASTTSTTKYMVETSESTFENDIKDGIVLVDFWATWCAPCQVLTPKMEAIAQKHANEVKVLKLDVDKCKSLAKEYKAEFIPMVVIMKDGKEIGRLVGADFQNTEEVIWQKIKAIIK